MDKNQFLKSFNFNGQDYHYYSLQDLATETGTSAEELPYCIKVILESELRHFDGHKITEQHITQLANWANDSDSIREVPFKPYRILLHDTTGVPAIVDIAMLRDYAHEIGEDIDKVNPLIPIDLVIDHSLMVDFSGNEMAIMLNEKREFERNEERFKFIKWAQGNLDNFRAFPPSSGIMHQINLEYLGKVAVVENQGNEAIIYPDSLVGADSHTTMINGLGIVGYGVGGIEAEAAMLGEPMYLGEPKVVGFKMTGSLAEGTTATDLALTVTNKLREYGVVGKFVEFFGDGVDSLTVFDRATISNMAPEYGATMAYFPVDNETLRYLRIIGRAEEDIELIQRYFKEQGLYREKTNSIPLYKEVVDLDLNSVRPSLAGPKRPQDKVEIDQLKEGFSNLLKTPLEEGGYGLSTEEIAKEITLEPENENIIKAGSLVLASITSCTNTSNPNVLIAAGIIAERALENNLKVPDYVKTSFTPGSKVVTDYMDKSGLLKSLNQLGFNIAGYGCATCIGNSGELLDSVNDLITENDLVVASVLSGNRNFEGRVHPKVKANYLASPPLVVAFALAGKVDIDLYKEPLGYNNENQPVYLKDLWPSSQEIEAVKDEFINSNMFKKRYENIMKDNVDWNNLEIATGKLYDWDSDSTYIQKPPFLDSNTADTVDGSRILLMLGDSVTTDHISPSGRISVTGPTGDYLMGKDISPRHFNSYPSRRGNFEVMVRAAFANVRLRNRLVPEKEGGYTVYFPDHAVMSVYEAAEKYKADGIPLVIIAGKEYGTGSSRDWAAKGTLLLGVKTVIAESFERIHRSNLIGMGVLPLQFANEANQSSLLLNGTETFYFQDQLMDLYPGKRINIKGVRENGEFFNFAAVARLDNNAEVDYYNSGGILPYIIKEKFSKTEL